MKKYYATFKGIKNSDISEFKTEQERDDWVNFRDPFSIYVGNTPENCIFERMELNDESTIDSVVKNKNIPTVQDESLPEVKWYLRSIA